MTKAHLISAATALTLGYGAGFASDNLVAATSVPQALVETASKTFDAETGGHATLDTLRGQAAAVLCDQAEQKRGLADDDCGKPNVKALSIHYDTGDDGTKSRVSARFEWDGTLTLGAPQ